MGPYIVQKRVRRCPLAFNRTRQIFRQPRFVYKKNVLRWKLFVRAGVMTGILLDKAVGQWQTTLTNERLCGFGPWLLPGNKESRVTVDSSLAQRLFIRSFLRNKPGQVLPKKIDWAADVPHECNKKKKEVYGSVILALTDTKAPNKQTSQQTNKQKHRAGPPASMKCWNTLLAARIPQGC